MQYTESVLDAIPVDLRQRPQWVLWKWETNEGSEKRTKVPYTRGRRRADKTKPEAWASFDQVVTTFRDQPDFFSGIGYCFTDDDPFCGIDLDHCIDPVTQALEPWAQNIVTQIDSYSEISPSGTGLKAIIKAKLPGDRHVKLMGEGRRVELYDHGWFFTVTGQQWGNVEVIGDRQNALADIYSTLFPPDPVREVVSLGVRFEFDSDEALVEKAFAARNGIKLAQLFAGDISDYGGDDSRADAGFCSLLAFYTEDHAQIDRIYRRTHLMRSKWDTRRGGSTYGGKTIDWAVANSLTHYAGPFGAGLPEDIEITITSNGHSNGASSEGAGLEFKLEGVHSNRWGGVSALIRAFQNESEVDFTRLSLEESPKRIEWARILGGSDQLLVRHIKRQLDDLCRTHLTATVAYQDDVLFTPTISEADSDYALEPYILNGEGTICFGPRSSGKTWLFLLMAVCLDAGLSTIWPVPVKKNILLINLERDKRILSRRLRKVNRFLGLPVDRPIRALNCRGMNMNQVHSSALQACQEHNIDVAFLDSILPAIAGPGVTIKDDEAANALVKQLTELCITWFALAHVGHGDPTRPIGSTVYSSAPGILIGVKSQDKRPDEQKLGIALHMTKNNDGAGGIARPQYWTLEEKGPDIDWRLAEPGEYPKIEKLEKPEEGGKSFRKSNAEQAADWLLDHGNTPTGITALAEALDVDKSNLDKALRKSTLVGQTPEGKWLAIEWPGTD